MSFDPAKRYLAFSQPDCLAVCYADEDAIPASGAQVAGTLLISAQSGQKHKTFSPTTSADCIVVETSEGELAGLHSSFVMGGNVFSLCFAIVAFL